jgi:sugar phosphate permease
MTIGLALRVFVPFALGYYMSYVFRAINAVIAPDLVRDIGLDAASLGMLTSMYYLTFAAVQLPLGLLLDRIGPRRTEAALLLVAAAGALIFALAQSLSGLALGRGLIGLGVSACLMSGVTAFARWFPRERLAFVNGCLFTAGGFGAIAATTPVEAALAYMDWRGVFLALAVMTLAVAAIIFIFAPEKDPGSAGRAAQTVKLAQQIAAMRQIVAHPMFIRIMPFAILTQSANLSMPTLWAGPWLADVARLTRDEVAAGLFAIAAGLMAGFFCMGLAAERLQKWGIDTASTVVGFGVLFMLVQLAILSGMLDAPRTLWALFAFMGTNGSLAYAALSQQFPAAIAGRVNTVLNLFVFVGAFAAQWGIGAIIHLWPQDAGGGFAPEGYAAAFWTMLVLEAAGLLWIVLSRTFKSTMPRDIGSAT